MRGRRTILVAIALLGLVSSSSGVERQPTIKMPANKTADHIALVVANANYPDAEAPLSNVRADEAALADALRQKGYDVELVADATREQAVAVAVRAYAEEINRQNHERRAQAEASRRALEKIERSIKGIMDAIGA
jgi:Caspase domain